MIKDNILYGIEINSIQLMQTKAERKLNPLRYYFLDNAKKRLRWMYIIYYECNNNISQAANKIGISREWLSKTKSVFENNNKDPKSLEPESKAPYNTNNRRRISKEIENKINEFWKKENNYKPFQKQKIALSKWEYIYNHLSSTQALGYLTPIEFYNLWKKNPKKIRK